MNKKLRKLLRREHKNHPGPFIVVDCTKKKINEVIANDRPSLPEAISVARATLLKNPKLKKLIVTNGIMSAPVHASST